MPRRVAPREVSRGSEGITKRLEGGSGMRERDSGPGQRRGWSKRGRVFLEVGEVVHPGAKDTGRDALEVALWVVRNTQDIVDLGPDGEGAIRNKRMKKVMGYQR